jgi:hypothetical protein
MLDPSPPNELFVGDETKVVAGGEPLMGTGDRTPAVDDTAV